MCAIIDANAATDFFSDTPTKAAAHVLDWIDSGNGTVVFGGKLGEELAKVGCARKWLAERFRAGRAIRIADATIKAEQEKILKIGGLQSNDSHVIALARASGARLLCSGDKNLHKDFKNSRLVGSPKGVVYQTELHKDLLTKKICANCRAG